MSQQRKERILITGASGMLGKDLVDELRSQKSDHISQVIPTDINTALSSYELDISQPEATQKIIDLSPTLVIHLAAYTDVDGCELDPDRAFKVNSIGTKNVALACQKLCIPILYISTDYVFDGDKPTPYVEWDAPNPLNIYGQTKLQGELWVRGLVKDYWIVRTSGLYGKGGKNFVDTILKKAKESHEIKVVSDQIGSPTYTKDLVKAIIQLITITNSFGIYHITNYGWVSWYEFAKTIVGEGCKISPISSAEVGRRARRPKNFRLLNFVWERVFKKSLRTWKEALNEYLADNRG